MARYETLADGCVRLLFGKHNGERIQEIPDGYLRWMVERHADGDAFFDEDLILACEEELASRDEHNTHIHD